MHIRKVTIENFTSHKNTEFTLPDRGLVIVTGSNGAGKSSLAEAVSWGLWGKTLRGTDPVAPGETCTTRIETDLVKAKRVKKSGGRASFSWEPITGEAQEYENNTKAKEHLVRFIGDLSVWRRTCVFSSHDAAHFTLASDGDRKRLLETLLNIDKFDSALKACRDDLKLKQSEISTLEYNLRILASRLGELVKRKNDAVASLEANKKCSPGDPIQLAEELAQTANLIEDYDYESKHIVDQIKQAESEIYGMDMDVARLQKAMRLFESGACPTCHRDLSEEDKDVLMPECPKDLAARRAKLASKIKLLHEEKRAVNADRMALVTKAAKLKADIQIAQTLAPERNRLMQALTSASTDIQQCIEESANFKARIGTARIKEQQLLACASVLGLKGVRAQVIASALCGLESAANAWLARIAGSRLSLEVKPYSQTSTGVSDAISMEVLGAGGGFGYRASSGGERRRLDISILLALAEVAAAAADKSPGTLFFDEVFDALDEDGIEAVVSALNDLSQDRAVVVITHSPELAKTLASSVCATKWHIEDGSIVH